MTSTVAWFHPKPPTFKELKEMGLFTSPGRKRALVGLAVRSPRLKSYLAQRVILIKSLNQQQASRGHPNKAQFSKSNFIKEKELVQTHTPHRNTIQIFVQLNE